MRPSTSPPALIAALVALAAAGCGGQSDEEEVRATAKRFSRAVAAGEYQRACEMFSLQAQAQIEGLVGGARGCASALALSRRAGTAATDLPSQKEIEAADLRRAGNRATLRFSGHDTQVFTKLSDRWLVAADTPLSGQRSLAACWRRAGAAIATVPEDLSFAAAFLRRSEVAGAVPAPAEGTTTGGGVNYIYADGWVIFYQYGIDEPTNNEVIRDPSRAVTVGYVREPARVAGVVRRANEC